MFVAPSGKTNNTGGRASLASGFIHDFAGCKARFTRVVHRVPTIGAHSGTNL